MTKHEKLSPKIFGIMVATSLSTFGSLVGTYYLLFPA
jgi:hypothetical protein